MPQYRNQGAVGALLDEYERAIEDLKKVIAPLSVTQLTTIVDNETEDEDCRSIQTILSHVLRAGYGYAIYVRRWKGEDLAFRQTEKLDTIDLYINELDKMFMYNEQLFKDYPDLKIEEFKNAKKIHVRWKQTYDVEQLFEHAIVHILRHRRQIERFLYNAPYKLDSKSAKNKAVT